MIIYIHLNTRGIHAWHIYLHLFDFYGKCRYIYLTWMVYDGTGYNHPLPFLSDFWFQVEKWNLARMDTHVRPWKYFGSHNTPQPFQKESMSANQKINWIPTRQIGQFPKRRFETNWKFITSINSKLSALRRCFCAKKNTKNSVLIVFLTLHCL